MKLIDIVWPWGRIADLKREVAYWHDESEKLWTMLERRIEKNDELRRQLAKFDHDGDGKPGGSKPRDNLSSLAGSSPRAVVQPLTDADVGFPECP